MTIIVILILPRPPTSEAPVLDCDYCECGCGEMFPVPELAKVPTGFPDRPYDFFHISHLYQQTG